MDTDHLISIIIPAYNRAYKISDAIKSIQAQTYQNWELIVVDDGSKDNIKEVMHQVCAKDNRIQFIRHNHNRGAQAARNTGIKMAKGEWIAFLDSDDQWLPESLTLRMEVARRDNVAVVHSGAYIQHNGKAPEIYHLPAWSGNIYRNILAKEGPVFPALLVKKKALERIGYLDERITAYQEWDTCIRLAKYFEFGFVPLPTFIYDYRTPNAISRDAVRNGLGYEQNLSKCWKDIIFYAGLETLSTHYKIASSWYQRGNDQFNSRRCAILALALKLLSPEEIIRKVKHFTCKSK